MSRLTIACRACGVRAPARIVVYLLLILLTLGEGRIFERLLFNDPPEYGFVLANISGVLDGTPVSKSWQHRLISPFSVAMLEKLTKNLLDATKLFYLFTLFFSNWLLFELVRGKNLHASRYVPSDNDGSAADNIENAFLPLMACVCFGFGHTIFAYRLEYPWDGVDIIVFLAFGYIAQFRRLSWALAPLILVGTFNHETILYVPLWYLIASFDPRLSPMERRKSLLFAASVAAFVAATVYSLRHALYVGRPNLPGQQFEQLTPVIDNHWHLMHNLRMFLREDWSSSQRFISASLFVALASFVILARDARYRTACLWSIGIIATIFCFGYINETRHYLTLLAFWTAYAWPSRVWLATARDHARHTPMRAES